MLANNLFTDNTSISKCNIVCFGVLVLGKEEGKGVPARPDPQGLRGAGGDGPGPCAGDGVGACVGDGRRDALAAGLGSRQAEREACAGGEGRVAGHGGERGVGRRGAAVGALKIVALQ